MDAHPSRLELDRTALSAGSPETAQHLSTCTECRLYVERMQAPPPLPNWVKQLPEQQSLWARLRVKAFVGMTACAAAAALFIVASGPAYVGEKGDASFAVYVQRDGKQFLWNGAQALRALDKVQIKADAHGYKQIAIGSISAAGAALPLYQDSIEAGPHMLPTSWTMDAAPGPERLVIAFSKLRLTAAQLTEAAKAQPRTEAVWASAIELPKEKPQ